MTAARFFIIELAFCKRNKTASCWTHKSPFFNEVAFYFVWLLHCIKSVNISLYSVWMRESVGQNNSKYGHFLRSVVI